MNYRRRKGTRAARGGGRREGGGSSSRTAAATAITGGSASVGVRGTPGLEQHGATVVVPTWGDLVAQPRGEAAATQVTLWAPQVRLALLGVLVLLGTGAPRQQVLLRLRHSRGLWGC